MIFVDTNFFLRFLLKDNPSQFLEAKELFLKAAKDEIELISSVVVFFELNWVLKSYYGLTKNQIIKALDKVIKMHVEFHERETIQQTLLFFETTNLDLEDCYYLAFAKHFKVTDFKTFDQKLKKKFRTL